eukprot:gene12772-3505_t
MDIRKRKAVSLETKRTIIDVIESKHKTQIEITREFGLGKSTAKSHGAAVGGPLLKQKANELATELGHEGFQCSDGWLDRFKRRRAITFRIVSGEANSVSKVIVDDWLCNKLPSLLEEYDPKDVFNADETGPFFKMLPDRTYTYKGDNCHGGKRSKEQITLMIAASMDGSEKLPLLAIGKSAKPRCFKNCTRPTHCHKTQSIQLEYLPPNCTSRLQPYSMGIIKNLKIFYRKRLLSKLIRAIEEKNSDDITVNILECLRWSKSVWENEVTQETIA